MHCLGCPASRGETVEEACAVHGVDVDKLLALVNEEANKPSPSESTGQAGTHTARTAWRFLLLRRDGAMTRQLRIAAAAALLAQLVPQGAVPGRRRHRPRLPAGLRCCSRGVICLRHRRPTSGGSRWSTRGAPRRNTASAASTSVSARGLTPSRRRSATPSSSPAWAARPFGASSPQRRGRATGGTRCCSSRRRRSRSCGSGSARTATPSRASALCATRESSIVVLTVTAGERYTPGRGAALRRPCARARPALRRRISPHQIAPSAPPGRGPAAVGQRRSGRLCRAGGRAGSKEREVGT